MINFESVKILSETFFEKFKIKGLAIYEESLVTLLGQGLISGLVVHSSYNQSYSICIYDGEIFRETLFNGGFKGVDIT